jgi:hypothetical protein
MNADDKIRAILRTEADTVDPSAAGWDAITTGIAARRRRTWWLRGSAFAAAAATVVAVALFSVGDRSERGLDQATTPPSPPTSTTPLPGPSEGPIPGNSPIAAIWPLTTTAEVRSWETDHSTYPSLDAANSAALAFAHTYLGIADASVVANGERFDVTRPVNGQPHVVTTLTVAGFGSGDGAPYVVTLATSPSVSIDRPPAGALLTSPVAAHGMYRTVEPSFTVSLRADTGGTDPVEVATAHATTGPPNDWDASLTFATAASTGSLLVTNGSLVDSGLADAAAVPVTFGRAAGTAPAAFVASRDGRLAVFATATGKLVRYLTDWVPGGGSSSPALSADAKTVLFVQGGGTCSTYLQSVPIAGGTPTTLVPSEPDTVVGPATRLGSLLAYARVHCSGSRTSSEIVVGDKVTPVDGDVRSGPVFAGSHLAYVTVKGATTTLHNGTATVPAPTGCDWLAVTTDGTRLVAAAACGDDTRLYRLDADSTDATAFAHLGSLAVRTLDHSADGRTLVIGTLVITGTTADYGAYVWDGAGAPRRIPGRLDAPSWS